MNSIGDFISSLQEQYEPMTVVGLLFGTAAILGMILGICLMGLIAAVRKRRALRKLVTERNQLKRSLQNSQSATMRLQTAYDTLNSKHKGVDAIIMRQKKSLASLNIKLASAEDLIQQNDEAKLNAVRLEKARQEEARLEEEARRAAVLREKKQLEESRRAVAQQRAEARREAAPAAAKAPPTLIRRVSSQDEEYLTSSETGIIGDDEIIPILPEAELTANVEAYDLSELEELIGEDP